MVSFLATYLLHAQIEVALAKTEVTKVLKTYEATLNTVANTKATSSAKIQAQKALIPLIASPNILVLNDFEEGSSEQQKIQTYFKSLEEKAGIGAKVTLDYAKMQVKGIYVNANRNAYQVKVTITKKIEFLNPDSSYTPLNRELDIYFFVKEEFGKYREFKIEAIMKKGVEPVYGVPLAPQAEAWVKMDSSWKKIFIKKFNYPKVPNNYVLDYVRNVDALDFTKQKINDFTPLKELTGLKELRLSKSNFSDVTLLSGLKNLKVLEISETPVRSLAGLENLTSLEILKCTKNEIKDITPLKGMVNLIELDLSENDIEDITPLQAMVNMEELFIGSNKIMVIDALKNMNKLEKLDFSKNKEIKDIEVLRNKYAMVRLDIFNTSIPSLEPITNLRKIMFLDCAYTKITSLDPIKGTVYLVTLNFSGNVIDDFSALNNYPHIQILNCATTNITDITPVMNMKAIQELYAIHTKFTKADIQKFKARYPKCRITYY